MGEYRYVGEPLWPLLAHVTDAAALTNTRSSLVRRVGETLRRHLPVSTFEMGWIEEAHAARVLSFRKTGGVAEVLCDLRRTAILPVLQNRKPHVSDSATEPSVVIPLVDGEKVAGYVRILFETAPPEDLVSLPVLETLGSILAFAQRHCRLIERIARVSSAAHHESLELKHELSRYSEADKVVAQSEAMRRVLNGAELVAPHDTTVLLRGESGTGKEVFARLIHRLSRRARQPFVSVNCGALPEALIESELFGHEKGAFTGAVSRSRGRFERANNGTIFLDEVAELPLSAQVKLLRVLQEGEFERLGGEEVTRVNVRVLAATNQPLEMLMEQGKFRSDLFYRINVFPIVIPPLRDRKEDIPVLARQILTDTARRLGCKLPSLTRAGISKLMNSPWPGNVRELANTLERALIVSQGRELDFSTLPVSAPAVIEATPTETFEDAARRNIRNALKACGGRIYGKDGAAYRLGIPPSTLQGKMRRLRISRREAAD